MNNESQDFRYMVKNDRLVVMSKEEEYQWLYDLIATEVKKKFPITDPDQKDFYFFEKDGIIKVQLQSLIEIAYGLGIDCEAVENHPRFFHINDKYGNSHGFDVQYFESRNPKILDSFADIITTNFECGEARVVPIFITSYPDSKLGDAIIIVSNIAGIDSTAFIIDYTDPEYTAIQQKLNPLQK
jgi:hypothetical protein